MVLIASGLWLLSLSCTLCAGALDDFKKAGYEVKVGTQLGSGMDAFVVLPKKQSHNNEDNSTTTSSKELLWVWTMQFPHGFETRTGVYELLEAGYAYAHLSVGNTFGSPSALKNLKDFHDKMTRIGYAQKAVLMGLSRGALFAFRYAAEYPSDVSLIYGDAPVLNFLSWPMKNGRKDWERLKGAYQFETDEEAQAFAAMPIADTSVRVLREHSIPVVIVVGDKDTVVPIAENTDIFVNKYRALKGNVVVIHKQHDQHVPHGLDDSSPVVDFILSHDHHDVDKDKNGDSSTSGVNTTAATTPTRSRMVLVPSVFKEWSKAEDNVPEWYGDKEFIAGHGKYDTFLYQKLDPSADNYLECNRGAENAVYYEYIVSHYDDLHDITIFTHAKPLEHAKNLFDNIKCIRPDASYHSLNLDMYKCVDSWNGLWARYAIWLEQCLRDTMRLLWKLESVDELDKRVPPNKPFKMCGHMSQQFFVSREQIHKRPLEEWKRLRDLLSRNDVCHKGDPDYEHLFAFNASSRLELGPEDPELGVKHTSKNKYHHVLGRLTQALTSEHLAHMIFGGHTDLVMPIPTMESVCEQFLDSKQCPGSPCVDLANLERNKWPSWVGHTMNEKDK
jgi:hypothetical protein